MQDEFSDVELFRITTELAIESTVAEEDKWLTDMHQFLSTGLPPEKMDRDEWMRLAAEAFISVLSKIPSITKERTESGGVRCEAMRKKRF